MTALQAPPCRYSSLCRPDDEKSCFGCCPPIRPPGHDHLDRRDATAARLEQNRRAWLDGTRRPAEIDGWSCWALGWLDPEEKTAGCLLHPAVNRGRDRRDLAGYGDKCRREVCREAAVFERLDRAAQAAVLALARGLDCFEYSSRRVNPVFRLLLWGEAAAAALAEAEGPDLDRGRYQIEYRALARDLDPALHGYAFEYLLARFSIRELVRPERAAAIQEAVGAFVNLHRPAAAAPLAQGRWVHQLGLPPNLARLFRTGLDSPRLTPSRASRLRRELEAGLDGI